jgi:uncharacterized membrane protein YeaQ/YmgE (transglycosylase-associated protein family)
MGATAFVFAFLFDKVWPVITWIVAGGIAGAISDRVIQGNRLGCLGNVAVGIVGGLLFAWVLDLIFNLPVEGFFWTFIVALVGSAVLLLIINLLTRGRGIGGRQR